MGQFEFYPGRNKDENQASRITIYRSGLFSINRTCYDKFFKDHKYVFLGYNSESKQIGLKPTNKECPATYLIRPTKEGRYFLVSAQGFLSYYGLHDLLYRGLKLSPVWDKKEGMITIQLR